MKILPQLFENNQEWASRIKKEDPGFFDKLSDGQAPPYLWIGCSDSRVPANEIVGLPPGDLFVHRNVANVVVHSDLNSQSVIQYAVEVLKVEHVIVCGHYGCGGVQASLDNQSMGLIDNWITHIRDVIYRFQDEIDQLETRQEKLDRLCELNVFAQTLNVCHSPFVQKAWKNGQPLSVHGWIYNIANGKLKDLDLSISSIQEIPAAIKVE